MKGRDLALSERKEHTRDKRTHRTILQFGIEEIKEHFNSNLLSIKNQFEIAQNLLQEGKENECKTIWRSQIVLLDGILDFYIHEISKHALYMMFKKEWSPSEKYGSLMVPMREVECAIEAVESKDWFFEYLNDRFSRDVFLSAEIMKDQLNLIGISFGDVMKIAFPRETENDSHKAGKVFVQNLYERRNAIAHQNDRSHDTAEQNDISKEDVEGYIDGVVSIVEAINSIALGK